MKLAGPEDLPALTALWHACFGDPAETILEFFRLLWPEITVFTTEDRASMATAMPVRWLGRRAAYFYAVATDPGRRGEGLCRRLMAEAEAYLLRQGHSYALLAPAGPSLFSFYGGLGYETAFYCGRRTIPCGECKAPVRQLSPAEYAALRRTFAPEDSVEYSAALLALQASAGPLLEISGLGCAALEPVEGGYAARELLSPHPEAAASALCAYLRCGALPVKVPGSTPYGMAKSLDGSPLRRAYLGLAFE